VIAFSFTSPVPKPWHSCLSPSFQKSGGWPSQGAASNQTPASDAAALAQNGSSSAPRTMAASCSASAPTLLRLRMMPAGAGESAEHRWHTQGGGRTLAEHVAQQGQHLAAQLAPGAPCGGGISVGHRAEQ
jgi:hypothetical protein